MSSERTVRVGEFERAFTAALLAGDGIAAETTIREAMDAGLTSAEIDEGIIAPALWQIGALWERGEITVADEHLATEISMRVLALQREATRVAETRRARRVMLATPEGERHVVALRMAGNLLSGAGYWTVMLGPDVPAEALAASVLRHQPDVICLSVTMPAVSVQMMDSIFLVQAACPAAQFVVGGRGLTSVTRSQSGVGICERVSEVVEAVDASVMRAGLN
ncbi:MAG TPA: B12-binding domain-containing protein [Solirubrobacteraceae bacterium]|nr:B12-binding domain-containing protein [Solirubrobacteraceae bacterium]